MGLRPLPHGKQFLISTKIPVFGIDKAMEKAIMGQRGKAMESREDGEFSLP